MRIEVDIAQLLNIFSHLVEIIERNSSFVLWLKLMSLFRETIVLNPNIIDHVNSQQNAKFAINLLQTSIMKNQLDFYGEGEKQILPNLNALFQKLIFPLSYQNLIANLGLKPNDLKNQEKMYKLHILSQFIVEMATDVLI
mmetsp:Transcript_4343/g.7326  ORF Transcript_4343/g.7326 Transcript_4343/m.7326 type:complete len:140 (+) Transcript_4343:1267-1686(+)